MSGYEERAFYVTAMTLDNTLRAIDQAIEHLEGRQAVRHFPHLPSFDILINELRQIRQQVFDEFNRIVEERFPRYPRFPPESR